MAAATLAGAQADAMRTAAANENGAMAGFMGLGMAAGTGGIHAEELYAMGRQKEQTIKQSGKNGTVPAEESEPVGADSIWKCSCGAMNKGKFCQECGAKRPDSVDKTGWKCSCGAVNKGKFCTECGAKKPQGVPTYRCDKCGWEPEDPAHPPKFCPECGDPFGEEDMR